jgi:hypothetical protein
MFLDWPTLRPTLNDDEWVLVESLIWKTDTETIIIPAGFLTDLASIPWWLRWLFSVNGKHRSAAILHDYLFTVQIYDREQTDALFMKAMEWSGVRATQRFALHAGVRIGGWPRWLMNKRALATNPVEHKRESGLVAYNFEARYYG